MPGEFLAVARIIHRHRRFRGISLHVSQQSFSQTECQLFQVFQVFQSFKCFRCFSRSCELFHSWFLVEKELESLPGMVGKLSPGDSNLVRLCFAFESMHEYCEQIASKLLGIFREEITFDGVNVFSIIHRP